MQPEAFFLPTANGQRFCLFHPSHGETAQGLVLYIHPFADEMNKARRMAALQSRALAQAGYAVLQVDLFGCGDSSGDFGDADWQDWINDVVHACHWLRRRGNADAGESERAPLWLWGLRAGCLLGVSAAMQMNETCNFLFWQPPPSGRVLLQQFLRLKVAGDLLEGKGKGKEALETLRQRMNKGTSVEITGYMLSAQLAMGLEQAELTPPSTQGPTPRLEWLEVFMHENANISPVSARNILQWQRSGYNTGSHAVQAPPFWQTTERVDAPALIAATMTALVQPGV